MELETIPGVGEKTARRLAALDDPEETLRRGDVARITSTTGMSRGRAVRIVRGVIRREHDDPGGFLGTDRTREIHRDLLSKLAERTVTDHAAARLQTFYPSARRSRIEEARGVAERALERDLDPAVTDALSGVEPLEAPGDVRVSGRCLATADAETYSEAREAFPELSVEIVDDVQGLAELARGYSTVIALDESFAGVAVDGDVRVVPGALETPVEIVPERPLAFFARNRDRVRAALAVHRATDGPDDEAVGEDALSALEATLSRLEPDGTVAGDEELDRLAAAADDLDTVAAEAETLANDRLREVIREQDVTIEGADLLSLVERGAGVDSLLSRELSEEYIAAIEAARGHVIDALDLDPGEAELARRAFPEEPTFPVERDEDATARLSDELSAACDRRATRLKRDLAERLAGEREAAEGLVERALELDVELAIARFADDYDCTLPEFVWGEEGTTDCADGSVPDVEIDGGRSPLLEEAPEAIDPVEYDVSGVTLLSGVNSGGKTSTLDLVASVVVLAQMGLPVPADRARLRRFDELYYHAKTQGTLDAGAFESTVKRFADLTAGGEGTLVLVDELESITEPGASAKIIAGILEALDENGATAVIVSHLAGEIRETAGFDVPVDGIEAVGLVDGELVVNRSPMKGHLARSTPELIVEKLAGDVEEGSGREAEFYDRLLEKFDS